VELSPTLKPKNAKAWHAWLSRHASTHRGLFLLFPKKHLLARHPGLLTYEQAIEEALCFGWVDGLVKFYDADYRAIRFSPRRDDSMWSEPNKRRVAKLTAEGRIQPAGRRLIELAKRNGEWAAARRREALSEPAPLLAALSREAAALTFWRSLAPSHRKLWLYWVTEAKKPETQKRRIEAIVRECIGGRKPGATLPTTQA
jgi:uncharacterized protein YdeI (YjbR/CyaY-like superfamily)